MGNSSANTAPTRNELHTMDAKAGARREWINSWLTVIFAEVLSAFTRCEELVLDPLLMHF